MIRSSEELLARLAAGESLVKLSEEFAEQLRVDAETATKPEWLEAMSVLTVQPGDVIVLKASTVFSLEQRNLVEAYFGEKVGAAVVLLDNGIDIGVLRQSEHQSQRDRKWALS